jgi:hypothetical protein
MCDSREKGYNNAERYAIGTKNSGFYKRVEKVWVLLVCTFYLLLHRRWLEVYIKLLKMQCCRWKRLMQSNCQGIEKTHGVLSNFNIICRVCWTDMKWFVLSSWSKPNVQQATFNLITSFVKMKVLQASIKIWRKMIKWINIE